MTDPLATPTAVVARLFALIRSMAVVNPGVSDLYDRVKQSRSERMTHNARLLAATGALRPGLSPQHAADIIVSLCSSATYESLVLTRGWTDEQYEAWLADTMQRTLLA